MFLTMMIKHSCCYLLRNLFFFFWDVMQQYHETFVYILVEVFVTVSVFHLLYILSLVCYFNERKEKKRKQKKAIPANNQNLERDLGAKKL